jgi:hypothetical protein
MSEQPTGAELLQARLSRVVDDLLAGRITPAEANRITTKAGRELRAVEAALRVARTISKIEP